MSSSDQRHEEMNQEGSVHGDQIRLSFCRPQDPVNELLKDIAGGYCNRHTQKNIIKDSTEGIHAIVLDEYVLSWLC